MGDDLDRGAKLSLKGINGHDPSSSLLCIYDRGGQPVAFFKGHTAGADQKPASSLSFSCPNEVEFASFPPKHPWKHTY